MFKGKISIYIWNGFYFPSGGCQQAKTRAEGKSQETKIDKNNFPISTPVKKLEHF